MRFWIPLFILLSYLFFAVIYRYPDKKTFIFYEDFRSLPRSESSIIRDAYKVSNCGEEKCVPGCWDDKSYFCFVCSQNQLDPSCITKNKEICERCPYCIWDDIENECINRPLGVIADEYDIDPYKAAFEINRPWNIDC